MSQQFFFITSSAVSSLIVFARSILFWLFFYVQILPTPIKYVGDNSSSPIMYHNIVKQCQKGWPNKEELFNLFLHSSLCNKC